ncbi:uncharacterized protein [Haliotis cracherodii]|uniref:uncharacterized protein n=1 Tax=Haliotis cracherodii TaxID=6455 RepID=UPI0039E81645
MESILCIDDGVEDKILCFATSDRLHLLQEIDTLYMDGTFYSCPPLWDQLYVIHGLVGTKMTQIVFRLLPNRQRQTYERLFRLLKDAVHQSTGSPPQPQIIQTGFEVAAIRAIETLFPDCDVRGCFFHYSKALWRMLQRLDFSALYQQNPEVNAWVRRAAALPLLPVNLVQDTFIDVMDSAAEIPQAVQFRDYMTNTWIDNHAQFQLGLWNHHDNIGPRTNNHLEGWHCHLNKLVQRAHPNVFAFIKVIQRLEKTERNKLAQYLHGARPPPRKRIYLEINQRLERLQEQLRLGIKSPLQFLDAAGFFCKTGLTKQLVCATL